MDSRAISVLLADEHKMYREALSLTFAHSTSLRVIGQCGNGPEALAAYEKLHPDILILDITMQSMRGFTTTEQILTRFPEAKIIWMSTFFNNFFYNKLAESGVRGYMTKSMSHLLMIEAIEKVFNGATYWCDRPEKPV